MGQLKASPKFPNQGAGGDEDYYRINTIHYIFERTN